MPSIPTDFFASIDAMYRAAALGFISQTTNNMINAFLPLFVSCLAASIAYLGYEISRGRVDAYYVIKKLVIWISCLTVGLNALVYMNLVVNNVLDFVGELSSIMLWKPGTSSVPIDLSKNALDATLSVWWQNLGHISDVASNVSGIKSHVWWYSLLIVYFVLGVGIMAWAEYLFINTMFWIYIYLAVGSVTIAFAYSEISKDLFHKFCSALLTQIVTYAFIAAAVRFNFTIWDAFIARISTSDYPTFFTVATILVGAIAWLCIAQAPKAAQQFTGRLGIQHSEANAMLGSWAVGAASYMASGISTLAHNLRPSVMEQQIASGYGMKDFANNVRQGFNEDRAAAARMISRLGFVGRSNRDPGGQTAPTPSHHSHDHTQDHYDDQQSPGDDGSDT